ncbi:peptidoglycan-binding protein [Amycolatopsis sp. NPDC049252]|uniref:peptidoglycan-binding domain-containing protein n=1 Tax=Amycolatopsis sp. NPDC049252 TaxID=3363933 RepID=UPI003710EBF5
MLPKVQLKQVVDDANRAGKPCGTRGPSISAAFCWQDISGADDENTTDWYPQGITTSADADASGQYQDRTVIATSWYWHAGGTDRGDRIAFVDYSHPDKPVYRFVLLVAPVTDSAGRPDFKQLTNSAGESVHGGGMFWYDHYLYVVDTTMGLRVFDLDHLWEVDSTQDTIGRQANGKYEAFGYKYVLPQAFTYTSTTSGSYPPVRFSSTALDRTGPQDSMVVSEYNTASTDPHRLIRYPMDPATFTPRPSADGLVHGTEAYETGILRVQGTASVRGRFYASTSYSTSSAHYGSLSSYTPAQSPVRYENVLPPYPEDLSYWPGRDQLWSQSEDPGSRAVYAMQESLLAWPVVQSGSTGADVTALQYLLNGQNGAGLDVDGEFGPATAAAVKAFQSAHGLSADGVAGPRTWSALTPHVVPPGDSVRALQTELSAHGRSTPATGTMDAVTVANLRAFQVANGHQGDGVTDLDTWRDLIN